MAEEGNKVVIEVDLESSEFTKKVPHLKSTFEDLHHSISSGMDKAALGVISFNQALEIGEKLLEGMHMAMQAMEKAETFENQELAFHRLTQSIGVDSELLIKAIQKSSHGTVSQTEAIRIGMQSLQAGMRADLIPQFVAMAEKLENTSSKGAKFADIMQVMNMSIETGAARGLKQFGLEIDSTGSRLDIQHRILAKGTHDLEAYGEGYDITAKKAHKFYSDVADSIVKATGALTTFIAKPFLPDSAADDINKVKTLEEQMGKLQERLEGLKNGGGFLEKVFGKLDNSRPILEAEKDIARVKEQINEINDKTKKDESELLELSNSKVSVKKILNEFEKTEADVQARKIAGEKIVASEEIKDNVASLESYKFMQQTRRAELEKTFSEEKKRLGSMATSEAALKKQLIELEVKHQQAIRALRVGDEEFNKSLNSAQEKYVLNNIATTQGAKEKLISFENAKEIELNKSKLESLRSQSLSKIEFDKKMEQEEDRHQKAMMETDKKYTKMSVDNFKLGWSGAIKDMSKQYLDFSAVTARATQKTHSIMTKGFVDMAKAHKFSMDQMLSQFLEMIGTEMIQSGVFMMMEGIWPPNPVALSGGAALVAAGSALVGASGSGAPADAGGGGGSSGSAFQTQPQAPGQAPQQQLERKSAQIIIQGDYLNSRETANHLAEVLRSNSDVTDYAIVAQGKAYG